MATRRTRCGSCSKCSSDRTQRIVIEEGFTKNEGHEMKILNLKFRIAWAAMLLSSTLAHADPLRVCTTTTDLGALVHEVGGDEVRITTFAKGTEDAHFIEARPSFVKVLSGADLYVQTGLELEVGWAPVLLKSSRNAK